MSQFLKWLNTPLKRGTPVTILLTAFLAGVGTYFVNRVVSGGQSNAVPAAPSQLQSSNQVQSNSQQQTMTVNVNSKLDEKILAAITGAITGEFGEFRQTMQRCIEDTITGKLEEFGESVERSIDGLERSHPEYILPSTLDVAVAGVWRDQHGNPSGFFMPREVWELLQDEIHKIPPTGGPICDRDELAAFQRERIDGRELWVEVCMREPTS